MWWRVKWLVLWSLWAGRLVRQPTPPVRVSSGWLRGSIAHSGTHAHYLGIPYATLKERFQAPGPEPTWNTVYEAIQEYMRCTQGNSLEPTTTRGEEDCMILNVYTPLNILPDKPLPVMVYIHGGGFLLLSATRMVFGPEYLTGKGVVLVTLNYRLTVQGFLCLGIKGAAGNAGMKDQVAALKWIQRNIRAFGGDPDNVTIFGESAGGASVSFHVLSPMSKGLFHKAIMQSGSSLSSWALQYEPVHTASLLAKTMGFDSPDPDKLYKFFMEQADNDLIINKIPRQDGHIVISIISFTPCVEKNVSGEEAFLSELPYDLLARGKYHKVPIMIGSNTQEGLYFTDIEKDDLWEKLTFEKALPKDLEFFSNKTRKTIANRAKELYLGDENISKETKAKISKLYGEPLINYPALEETELLLKTSGKPIYHYLFNYEGLRSIAKQFLGSDLKNIKGAGHSDELMYLFSQHFIPSFFENEMIDRMSTMWTNFAKFGDPTPSVSEKLPIRWPALTREDKRALLIDHKLETVPLWYSESLRFWRDVYSKHRRRM